MKATYQTARNTRLQTTDPVVAVKTAMASIKDSLTAVQTALRQGVDAIPDMKRSGFYEIEIGNCWYYIHIPNRIARVYVVAAGLLGPQVRMTA